MNLRVLAISGLVIENRRSFLSDRRQPSWYKFRGQETSTAGGLMKS